MEKKFLPKLYLRSKDLKKRWYVGYQTKGGKRVQVYGNLQQFKTVKTRLKAAEKLLKEQIEKVHKEQGAEELNRIEKRLNLLASTYREATRKVYKSAFKIFRKYVEPRGLEKKTMEDFFWEELTTVRKLAPKSFNWYLSVIKQFLGWVDKAHLLKEIKKRTENPTPAAYFTKKQIYFLMNYLSKHDDELFFFVHFLYFCFLRPKEISLLKVGHIILEEKKILVLASIAKNKKQQYITIPDAFFHFLERKIKNRNPNEFVFYTKSAYKPMGVSYMSKRHRIILKKIHMDTTRYKLYSWKHTGAVAATLAGVHIKQLQTQLRHSSLDQVDQYLRQLGVIDLMELRAKFPKLVE